jgi:hypothetical protein
VYYLAIGARTEQGGRRVYTRKSLRISISPVIGDAILISEGDFYAKEW